MSKKRIVRTGIIFVFLVAVSITVHITLFRINSPSSSVISTPPPTPVAGTSFNLHPIVAKGHYVSFNYPAGMQVAPNNPSVGPVLEQFNFLHHDIETWVMAIDVLNIPGGQLSANTAYQYRKDYPNQYKESHIQINGKSVDIMTTLNSGGFNEVAFLTSSSYQATVSLYGDDSGGTSNLQKTFTMVLSSWTWL